MALKVKDTRVWDKDEWEIRLLLTSPTLEERKKVKRKIHGKISLSCKRKKRNILRGHKIRRVFGRVVLEHTYFRPWWVGTGNQ